MRALLPLLLLPALLFAARPAWAQAPAEVPLSKLPKVKKGVEAVYPPLGLRDRIEAAVVLELEIDDQGYVTTADVVSSSTIAEVLSSTVAGTFTRSATIADYGFRRSASIAGARLEFEPAEAAGKPVAVRIQYTFRFKLPAYVPPPRPASTSSSAVAQAPAAKPGILNFTGRVRARGTRTLVPGVVVTVFRELEDGTQEGYESITDSEGVFKLYDLTPGEWKVLAEVDGYYPVRTTELIVGGQVTDATYFIEKGTYNPYDVLVEATRVKKEVNRRTLSIQEIVRVPGTLGDPIQVVENLPGVARSPGGGGLIIVRGSGPTDTGVFIDGIDIPLIYHFGGLRSVIPAEVIESIDFYPGNYPIYYGRKMGGVFDAKVKKLAPDQIHGSLDVSLLDTSLYLEMPIGDTAAIAIAGRRSYIDFVLNAVIPDDSSINLISAPRYYDYQIMANWRPSPEHEVRLFWLGSDDIFELLFENPSEFSVQARSGSLSLGTNFYRGTAEHRYTPGSSFSNTLRFAAGKDFAGFNFGSQFKFELTLTQIQLRELAEWKLSDAITLSAGLDGLLGIADVEVLLPRPPVEGQGGMMAGNPDADDVLFTKVEGQANLLVGPFVEATVTLFDDLTLVPGVRLDYWQRPKAFTADPRLVARYKITPQWVAKGGIGLVHQLPEPQDIDPVFGNPDIKLQNAIHYSLGAEWMPEDWWKVDVTLFYKTLGNLVSRTSATVEKDGKTVPLNVDNGGRGTVYGFELFLERKFHDNLHGWLSYTLSRAERIDSGSTDTRLFDYDQTHILNLVASYQFPENWELGIRWRLVSGNPSTPVTGGIYNSDLDMYTMIQGAVNSDRLPFFHQLDIRVDKTWIFDVWRFSAYLSLVNSYNAVNVEAYGYNFDFTEKQPTQGLPILPILGVKGQF